MRSACPITDRAATTIRRQIDRWSGQYRASETGPIPAMDRLIAALDHDCPADDGQVTLVHGDFRIDNLLFAPEGPEVRAVLDWELSTLGHPFADLAAVIMQWQMPTGAEGRGLAGVDRAAEGLVTDGDLSRNTAILRGDVTSPISGYTSPSAFSGWRRSCKG
jgi:aminoglycoside phosphotransferase (APT) family kinase protein